jgi:hypothetical protein
MTTLIMKRIQVRDKNSNTIREYDLVFDRADMQGVPERKTIDLGEFGQHKLADLGLVESPNRIVVDDGYERRVELVYAGVSYGVACYSVESRDEPTVDSPPES